MKITCEIKTTKKEGGRLKNEDDSRLILGMVRGHIKLCRWYFSLFEWKIVADSNIGGCLIKYKQNHSLILACF